MSWMQRATQLSSYAATKCAESVSTRKGSQQGSFPRPENKLLSSIKNTTQLLMTCGSRFLWKFPDHSTCKKDIRQGCRGFQNILWNMLPLSSSKLAVVAVHNCSLHLQNHVCMSCLW